MTTPAFSGTLSHMALQRLMLIAPLLGACATGAPMGSRFSMRDSEYVPFSRAAAPREAPPAPAVAEARPLSLPLNSRSTVLTAAQKLIGHKQVVINGVRYGDDCTGLVRGVFAQLHLDLLKEAKFEDNGVTAIWRFAASHGRLYEGGRPVAGDLVFFKDTYDLNKDGRDNDGLTHVGLVESVDDAGTVVVIHRVAKGIVRYKMNLALKDRAVGPDGKLVNDYLRVAGPKGKPLLTSELFAGYATILPLEPVASR